MSRNEYLSLVEMSSELVRTVLADETLVALGRGSGDCCRLAAVGKADLYVQTQRQQMVHHLHTLCLTFIRADIHDLTSITLGS